MSTADPPVPSPARPGYLLKRVPHALRNRMDAALRPIAEDEVEQPKTWIRMMIFGIRRQA